jgi:hypothetical protein
MKWNYQLSDEEVEAIVFKMEELEGSSGFDKKKDEALHAWSVIAIKDILTAMLSLGYSIVKTRIGTFIEIKS